MRGSDALRLILVAILLSYAFYVAVPALNHVQATHDIRSLVEIKREKQLAGLDVTQETKVIAAMRREDTNNSKKAVNTILKISIAGALTGLSFAWFRKFFDGKR